MVVGLDSSRGSQQFVVELAVKSSLLGDDAVLDARLIALRPGHAHLGRTTASAVVSVTLQHAPTALVQRQRLLGTHEERVEPEVKHLLLTITSIHAQLSVIHQQCWQPEIHRRKTTRTRMTTAKFCPTTVLDGSA